MTYRFSYLPIRLYLLALMVALVSPFGGASAVAAEMVQIVTLAGKAHVFQVEIADTPEKQARGLMHVASLPPHNGMLFPLTPPRQARFWMRNTLIPLDMIFIRPDGTISQIVTRRDTQSDSHTTSVEKVGAVLELNADEAAQLNIGVGDRVVRIGGRR